MMEKLYSVEVRFEVLVVATDESEAALCAERAVAHGDEEADTYASELRRMTLLGKKAWQLPEGWERNAIPYGGDGAKNVGEWLEELERREAQAEFEAKQGNLFEEGT